MRIGVICERRYLAQSMPGRLLRALAARGANADVICPDNSHFDPETGVVENLEDGHTLDLNSYDVLVSRNRNGLGLAMLSYAEAAGALTINSYAATERIRNKANMGVLLSRSGIACPRTILAWDVASLAGLAAHEFPLIVKPTYGDNCQGLILVRGHADLDGLDWTEDFVLAQRYLPNDGFDLKLYVCGETTFAVRKPSPLNGDPNAAIQIVSPTAEMIDLARRCGTAFGLEIFGVDTIETPDGLAVIEVNEFPNFSGIESAGECIAAHVIERAGKGVRRAATAHRVFAATLIS
jgi:glutathione synthase/RimK-type ligase-like ATP-grasp enzyme